MSSAVLTLDQTVIASGAKWEFDESVTTVFENMLERSIPQYQVMRDLVTALAARYAQKNTWIVDLGCSRGDGLRPIIDERGAYNRYLGIEISHPMAEAARRQFSGYIQTNLVEIRETDLREKYPPMKTSVTLAVLTLQFIPIEHRARVVQEAYHNLLPGGAFLVVEKILGATADLDRAMFETYYQLKAANGYTAEQIASKRKSLEGVLVPLTARGNEELLRAAGFAQIDCFWRWMNFAAWIAVKS